MTAPKVATKQKQAKATVAEPAKPASKKKPTRNRHPNPSVGDDGAASAAAEVDPVQATLDMVVFDDEDVARAEQADDVYLRATVGDGDDVVRQAEVAAAAEDDTFRPTVAAAVADPNTFFQVQDVDDDVRDAGAQASKGQHHQQTPTLLEGALLNVEKVLSTAGKCHEFDTVCRVVLSSKKVQKVTVPGVTAYHALKGKYKVVVFEEIAKKGNDESKGNTEYKDKLYTLKSSSMLSPAQFGVAIADSIAALQKIVRDQNSSATTCIVKADISNVKLPIVKKRDTLHGSMALELQLESTGPDAPTVVVEVYVTTAHYYKEIQLQHVGEGTALTAIGKEDWTPSALLAPGELGEDDACFNPVVATHMLVKKPLVFVIKPFSGGVTMTKLHPFDPVCDPKDPKSKSDDVVHFFKDPAAEVDFKATLVDVGPGDVATDLSWGLHKQPYNMQKDYENPRGTKKLAPAPVLGVLLGTANAGAVSIEKLGDASSVDLETRKRRLHMIVGHFEAVAEKVIRAPRPVPLYPAIIGSGTPLRATLVVALDDNADHSAVAVPTIAVSDMVAYAVRVLKVTAHDGQRLLSKNEEGVLLVVQNACGAAVALYRVPLAVLAVRFGDNTPLTLQHIDDRIAADEARRKHGESPLLNITKQTVTGAFAVQAALALASLWGHRAANVGCSNDTFFKTNPKWLGAKDSDTSHLERPADDWAAFNSS
eukprot:CAMPEP_0174827046 /NCGR_PEP_ID=MMETSP1114-20130205/431_1 /TAXON_ID=312471 /ORGANISM="Neobodo designis, Strain CCAP 1951/1" /LENGTH=707 /DNA_ID=CAMNT_0016060643 /DNA_START=196 /DNA_END=2319 /DNA_ORIENTATION=-